MPEWARDIPRDYLAESVQSRGTIVPIVVAKIKGDRSGKYILVDGRGRLEQAIQAEEKWILARIVQVENEEEALLLALELEQTREPWTIDYTLKIIHKLEEMGLSRKEIAEKLMIPRSRLYRILAIEEIEKYNVGVARDIKEGKLPLRAAEKIKQAIDTLRKMKREDEIGNLLARIARTPSNYENIIADTLVPMGRITPVPKSAQKKPEKIEEEIAKE